MAENIPMSGIVIRVYLLQATLLFIEVNLPVALPSAGVSSLNRAMWSAVLLQELEFHLQFVEELN